MGRFVALGEGCMGFAERGCCEGKLGDLTFLLAWLS